MISPKQIRAARALLDWKQADLAEAAGLSLTAVNNIEKGSANPRSETMDNIKNAFESFGIEFKGASGVNHSPQTIQKIEGKGSFLKLMDDVFFTLKDIGGELLIGGADERKSTPAVVSAANRMRTHGVNIKVLLKEGDTFLRRPPEEYRWVKKEYFTDFATLVYSNKVAFHLEGSEKHDFADEKVFILIDEMLSDAHRKSFNFMWDVGKMPANVIGEVDHA